MTRELVAEFQVDGEPISKARARFTKRGSKTFSYTPERTKEGERGIVAAYCAVVGFMPPNGTDQFAVEAEFIHGTRQRRDVDNMLKLVLDGLNGVAWMDDNQVTEIVARKIMGDRSTASTVVRVYRLGPIAKRTGTCEHCGSDFDWFPSQSARRFCTKECHYAWRRSRRSRTCSHCGVEFDGGKPDSMAQFCSREHAALHKRATVTCNGCGVKFTKQRCHVKATNYCSDECHKKANRERTLSREAGICQTCGGPTSKKSYRQCNGCVRGVSGKPQPVKEIPA